ncbi:MAG: hypothetical protein Q4A62_08970 [Eikenella sp.]|nr:hypothetical protein [Eikenella sp.]
MSYAYNKPAGSSRYGSVITYHYERVNVSQALELAYRTDHNGIVRNIQYRYIRY